MRIKSRWAVFMERTEGKKSVGRRDMDVARGNRSVAQT